MDPRLLVRFELVIEEVRTLRMVCFKRRLVLVFACLCFCRGCWLRVARSLEVVVEVVVAEQADVVVDVVRLPPNKHKGS